MAAGERKAKNPRCQSVNAPPRRPVAPSGFARFKGIVIRIWQEFSEDRIPTVAGGITFFVLLAMFPAIGAVVSLYGLFADRAEIARDLDMMSGFLPEGGVSVLRSELLRLAGQKAAALDAAFALSFGIALWSASGGFKAIVDGLNIAYEVRERRGFLRLTLNALLFTILGVALAAAAIALAVVIRKLGDIPLVHAIFSLLVWPLLFLAGALILAVIYRFGPDRRDPDWRWITWGSGTAAVLWMLGTQVFTWYVLHFGNYNRVYGDLGALVGFLTWIWLSFVVLLLGAEINCELEREEEERDRQTGASEV